MRCVWVSSEKVKVLCLLKGIEEGIGFRNSKIYFNDAECAVFLNH